VLKQGFLKTSGAVLLPDALALTARAKDAPAPPVSKRQPASTAALDWDRFITERLEAGSKELHAECLAVMERQLLTRILQRTGGNQLRAAELLGITRGSLRHKLRTYGLGVERSVCLDDNHDA